MYKATYTDALCAIPLIKPFPLTVLKSVTITITARFTTDTQLLCLVVCQVIV